MADSTPAAPKTTVKLPPAITYEGMEKQFGEAGIKAYNEIGLAGGFGDLKNLPHNPDLDLSGLTGEHRDRVTAIYSRLK